jgi:putative ABC transport system permease protein
VSYVQIPLVRLGAAGLLVLLAMVLSRRQKLGLEVDLLVGAVRAALQLIAVGFVLVLLFHTESVVLTVVALSVMLTVASLTAARRVKHGPGWRALAPRAFVAIGVAFSVALLPVLAWVIPVRPLLAAQYAIPIGGMVMASGMNVVTLVFERLMATAHQQADVIDQALALGASPAQAMAPAQRQALRAAMMPTINALLTLGLVQLPGMMTGQILSGTSPVQAVRYQLVIMYQLVAVAAVAGTLAAVLLRRVLFDEEGRLQRWSTVSKAGSTRQCRWSASGKPG